MNGKGFGRWSHGLALLFAVPLTLGVYEPAAKEAKAQ
jgi:hypothetical protein